ncbi:DUF6677 family protein [Acidipila sp. EB88]|uniref:DUF6677 family protein n=1 Tax=Acidipila sp. EB88 TaxID=2305226 RepID=UPI000F5D99AA|nr:DUF6677 family protein [Acidipila sp. EB88]RRA47754.1 hypothetical protein D1Y84_05055 [Acidipila sp. EB88]
MPDLPARSGAPVSLALLLGWLLPGAGHLLTRHWGRAALLFLAVSSMWWLGIAMNGHLYLPDGGDALSLLGFVGDLGSGLFYLTGYAGGLGRNVVQVTTADYGTKFLVVASLLNVIAAVDAHNLRIGRKLSGVAR